MAKGDQEQRPIVVKKVKKVSGGHHGGAWKVAYADFVTAMMAFFMLLWLLNVSDQETLQGLADYFTPSNASMSNSSGTGDILAGTALADEGAKASGSISTAVAAPKPKEADAADEAEQASEGEKTAQPRDGDWQEKIVKRENEQFKRLEDKLKIALQENQQLAEHKDQLLVEETPEGLRIQLIDKAGRPMFRRGSAELYQFAVRMLEMIADVIETMPNRVSISGHTDATPNAADSGYSNWELSSDRANAARRVLFGRGVQADRFSEVVGKADTEPLLPDMPFRPENKRISILLLREAPVLDPDFPAPRQ